MKIDLYKLAKTIFPQYVQFPPSRVHLELSDLLLKTEKSLVIAFPREFAKSTYAWLFFPSWNFFAGKYQFIVYIASSKERAEEQFKTLRAEVSANPYIASAIEVISDRADSLEYIDRLTGKRHYIKCFGAGQNLRGLRYQEKRPDIVIIDDIESLEGVMSENTRKKLKEWFFADVMPLSHTARFFVIGTVLHEDSLLNNLLLNPPQDFIAMRYAIIDDAGNPLWPERFSLTWIERKKEEYRRQGLLHLFYAEYMNQPIAEENQVFKREYFRYYNPKELDLRDCMIYTAVDLAISKTDTADYTAVVTVAVKPTGDWYVLDCDYGRYDPEEQIHAIFRAVRKWKPIRVGVEKVAYQKALIHFLEQEMRKKKIFFDVVPLIAEKAKVLRIQALQPRFKAGTIFFPEKAHFLSELEGELLMFPRGKHDDLIDALSYIEQIAFPPVMENFGVELPNVSAW